jgi:hypothetical protein
VRRVLEDWPGSTVSLSMWACTPSPRLGGRTPAQALGGNREGEDRE